MHIYIYIYTYIIQQSQIKSCTLFTLQAVSKAEALSSGVLAQLDKKTRKRTVQSTGPKSDFHFHNSRE